MSVSVGMVGVVCIVVYCMGVVCVQVYKDTGTVSPQQID